MVLNGYRMDPSREKMVSMARMERQLLILMGSLTMRLPEKKKAI